MDYIAFGVILDDIVFPNGETRMAVLGGGGPQTAFGMRMFSNSVGLVAGIGPDAHDLVLQWAQASEIDQGGLRFNQTPTVRAWQLMEYDGRRTQVWRIPTPIIQEQIGRSLERLPAAYRQARGYHFGIHPEEPDLDFIRQLRGLNGLISIEPFKPADILSEFQGTISSLKELLTLTDIFSANQQEAASLVGDALAQEQAYRLGEMGAKLVVVRMGEQGSIVYHRESSITVHVPAVPDVHVIDPVGAGNAYCGAFLVGWVQTNDLATAAIYGTVAASFLLEQVGVPTYHSELSAEMARRIACLEPLVSYIR